MSTFTLPSRQTFSFSPHSPPCSLVVPSLALSFSPHPPPCSLISHDSPVPIILSLPSALSSYLPASLDLSAHTLFAHAFSLLSLPFPFSRSALFFFLFHHHFSALLRSSPYAYSPLFPSSRLSSFRTFHTFFFLFVPVFVSLFLFPFLVYPFPFIHTLSHLSLPSFSCTRLPHVFPFPSFFTFTALSSAPPAALPCKNNPAGLFFTAQKNGRPQPPVF